MSNDAPTPQQLREQYRTLAAGFGDVLTDLPDSAWDGLSACEGWTGRDVVRHVIDTQRDFLTGKEVDLGSAPDLADPAAAWREHAGSVLAALADDAVIGRGFTGFFGPTTVGETLLRFYGFDMLAHRWDVAVAAGRAHAFAEEDLDALEAAIDGFGPALYAEGICQPALSVPDGADRTTALLARIGRSAQVG